MKRNRGAQTNTEEGYKLKYTGWKKIDGSILVR